MPEGKRRDTTCHLNGPSPPFDGSSASVRFELIFTDVEEPTGNSAAAKLGFAERTRLIRVADELRPSWVTFQFSFHHPGDIVFDVVHRDRLWMSPAKHADAAFQIRPVVAENHPRRPGFLYNPFELPVDHFSGGTGNRLHQKHLQIQTPQIENQNK